MKSNIKTDIEKAYTKFAVDDSVIEWLKKSVEIIIDITQKAVQENRFEIVESSLNNLSDITQEYILSRKDYSTEQDNFLIFIHEQLLDTKNLVKKDTHPKIMLSILKAARDISIASLEIKPIRAFRGDNFIPYSFINLIASVCLSSELLKETSYACMSSIDYLVEIAYKAIDKGFPRTALVVADKIGDIALTTTKLHFHYGDIIAGKANWALASILDYLLLKHDELPFHIEYEAKSIHRKIAESVSAYIEDEDKYHYMTRSNIKPLFGPLSVEEHGMASIFIKSLQKNRDEKYLFLILKILEEFLRDMNQTIMKGMKNDRYFDIKEILDHIYMVGIVYLPMVNEAKTPRLQVEMRSLLKNDFSYPFRNAISMSFKHSGRYHIPDDEYMQTFFSMMGIMFYENKKGLFTETLEHWTNEILEVIQKNKTNITTEHEGKLFVNTEITHPLSDLYRHLRLIGVWFNTFNPKSKLLDRIIFELKNQPEEAITNNAYGEKQPYPMDFIVERWIIQRPSLPFNTAYFSALDKALFNPENIKSFEKKLRK